jgi:hypothetical protein
MNFDHEEQFTALREAVAQIGDMQVRALFEVAQLRAQLVAQEQLIEALLKAQGVELIGYEELRKKYRTTAEESLKAWLASRTIITPADADPWWDRA